MVINLLGQYHTPLKLTRLYIKPEVVRVNCIKPGKVCVGSLQDFSSVGHSNFSLLESC